MNRELEIFITGFVIIILLALEHYFPWELIFKRKLPRLIAYIIGVLGLAIPLSMLYWYWVIKPPENVYAYILALWCIVISGGISVIGSYILDVILLKIRLADELKELLELRTDAEESRTDRE
jgi:hypothetical protein